jgi:hypothetical protein
LLNYFFDCYFVFHVYSLFCLCLAFALYRATKFYLFSPLPGGGEVDDRQVATDDSQEPLPESEAAGFQKSAGSSVTEYEQQSESGHSVSPPLAIFPGRKRKRDDVADSDASKPTDSAAEETSPREEDSFDPYDDAGIVSS